MSDKPTHLERPLSRHAAARLGYALTAVEISDYTAAVVPTTDDARVPGEFITQARRARALALELLVRAVLLERSLGHSWKQIALAQNLPEEFVREQYEHVELEWRARVNGGPSAEVESIEMAHLLQEVPLTEQEIRETASRLDIWCDRRRDQDSPKATLRLVSDGLAG